jgi:hypothetical protein
MPKGIPKSGTRAKQQSLSPQDRHAKRAELQAGLEKLEAQDNERFAAIGRAVEKHAEDDQKFAEMLPGILERYVSDRGERVCLGLEEVKRRGRRAREAADATLPSAAAMPTVSE